MHVLTAPVSRSTELLTVLLTGLLGRSTRLLTRLLTGSTDLLTTATERVNARSTHMFIGQQDALVPCIDLFNTGKQRRLPVLVESACTLIRASQLQ